jgi:hypothetical protein
MKSSKRWEVKTGSGRDARKCLRRELSVSGSLYVLAAVNNHHLTVDALSRKVRQEKEREKATYKAPRSTTVFPSPPFPL